MELEDHDFIEEEQIDDDIVQPYDVTKIDIKSEIYGVEYVKKKIDLEELILTPDFQRHLVWSPKQKSRLIESLVIKIPIPNFYIDGRDEDRLIVIDGLQRLSSIHQFMNNEFRLSNLEFLLDLQGKKFEDLERRYQRRIEDYQLHFFIIRPNTPSEVAFTIFTRINTLGTPLTQQEIRHAMHSGGKSAKFLEDLSQSREFIEALSEETATRMQKRMRDREIILRLLSFNLLGMDNYKGKLNEYLNKTMDYLDNLDDCRLNTIQNFFKKSMVNAKTLFGTHAFRKFSNTDSDFVRKPISTALFETFGNVLGEYNQSTLLQHREQILLKFVDLLHNDKEYLDSITLSTNNVEFVKYRFKTAREIIEQDFGE